MSWQALNVCLNVVSTLCWPVCFVWMHRIGVRQEELLRRLHGQNTRIEELSRAEHDLIKEVHPTVGTIKADVKEVKDALSQ